MSVELISKAAAFAKAAHESIDQRRKYSNKPYIVHPQAVANVTNDSAMLAAAWLHDVVEDTPVTLQEIEAEFGNEIASLVSDLTDISKPTDGNRKRRLEIDRQHSAESAPRAKTVKLADVIHNISDIVRQDPGFAVKYIEEKELLLSVLRDGDATLFKKAEQTIQDSKEFLKKTKS